MYIIFDSGGGVPEYYNQDLGWQGDSALATRYNEEPSTLGTRGFAIELYNFHLHPDEITLDITIEDIVAGVPSDCDHCPTAIAAGRACPTAGQVSVYSYGILIDGEMYAHTPETAEFIRAYDKKRPVSSLRATIRQADLPFREIS